MAYRRAIQIRAHRSGVVSLATEKTALRRAAGA